MDIYGHEFSFFEVNPSLRVAERGYDPLSGGIFLKLVGNLGEREWSQAVERLEEITCCSFNIRTSKSSKSGLQLGQLSVKYYV